MLAVTTTAAARAAARLQREAGARRTEPTQFEDQLGLSALSSIVVCAWCARYGRAKGAAREAHSRRWHLVSHEFVRSYTAAGMVSHGLCTWCRARIVKACA